MPRMKVASCAPTRVWMFFSAQRPNAALPPARLTSATIMPSSTRKRKMPALSAMAAMMPSLTIISSVATGEKLQANSAPITTPIKRDEYASLVISASVMAMIGGTSAQKVPTKFMMFLLPCGFPQIKKLSHDFHHDLTPNIKNQCSAPELLIASIMTALRPCGRQSAGYFPATQASIGQSSDGPFGGLPFRSPGLCRFAGSYCCQPRLYQDL